MILSDSKRKRAILNERAIIKQGSCLIKEKSREGNSRSKADG